MVVRIDLMSAQLTSSIMVQYGQIISLNGLGYIQCEAAYPGVGP